MSEIVKKPMSREQKRKFIERYMLYPIAALLGVIIIYIIFVPSSDKEEKAQSEFNVSVPEAVEEELTESKRSAYAKEQSKQEDEDRTMIKTLAENMLGMHKEKEATTHKSRPNYKSTPKERVVASTEAYRNMNNTVGSFYSTPKVDPEKVRMQEELDELKAQLSAQEEVQPTMGVEEQIALMEKSYELAARYMPHGQGSQQTTVTTPQIEDAKSYPNGKSEVSAVGEVREQVVSALAQQVSNTEFIAQHSQPRNYSFNTAIGSDGISKRNTISAVIHSDQTVRDGGAVRLRLIEPMMAGDKLLPRGLLVTGAAKIQGERLTIVVNHIIHQGVLTPVDLAVVDGDGVAGIFIPNSMEVNALKSIVANMSGSASTTINISDQSAGDQILTDLGTSTIDGISQYVATKVKEIKVHLKAGHKVMLYQKM